MRVTYLRDQWQQHPSNSSQDQLQAPAIRLLRPLSYMTPVYISVALIVLQCYSRVILVLHRMHSHVPMINIESIACLLPSSQRYTKSDLQERSATEQQQHPCPPPHRLLSRTLRYPAA